MLEVTGKAKVGQIEACFVGNVTVSPGGCDGLRIPV